MREKWLDWAIRIQSVAQSGATDLLPQSELIFIKGADHNSIIKQSEMYQTVIYFIEKCTDNK